MVYNVTYNNCTFEIVLKEKDIIRNYRIAKSIIGSHAVFNYLTVLQNQITFDQKRDALTGLSNYAKFVRHIMQQAELDYMPLEQEYLQLSMYLKMEQLRFGDSFEYEVKLDAQCSHTLFPVFVFLPFIELLVASIYKQSGEAKLIIELSNKQATISLSPSLPAFSTLERNTEQRTRYALWMEQIKQMDIIFKETNSGDINTYTLTK
jgi:LytS/YehU family sensor histidine kinase